MGRKDIQIKFINAIQVDSDDTAIEEATNELALAFKQGALDNTEFRDALEALVWHKKVGILKETLNTLKKDLAVEKLNDKLNYLLHDALPFLFIHASQWGNTDCQTALFDMMIDDATKNKNITTLEAIFKSSIPRQLLVENKFGFLDRLLAAHLTLTGTPAPSSFKWNMSVYTSLEIYDIFKKYQIPCEEDVFIFPLENINADVLKKIISSQTVIDAINQDEDKLKQLLMKLISGNQIKSLLFLIEHFKDDLTRLKRVINDRIIDNPLLINTVKMYDVLNNQLQLPANEFLRENYLVELCHKRQVHFFPTQDRRLIPGLRLLEEKLPFTGLEPLGTYESDGQALAKNMQYLALMALQNNLPKMINLFFVRRLNLLDERTIDLAISVCVENNNWNMFQFLAMYLPPQHPSLIKFFDESFSSGLFSPYLDMLIRIRGHELIALEQLKEKILRTDSPLLAIPFIAANLVEYPKETLVQLCGITSLQSNKGSLNEDLAFLEEKAGITSSVKQQQDPPVREKKESAAEEILVKQYGANMRQSQYDAYSQQIAGSICHAIANKQFSLLGKDDPDAFPRPFTLSRLGKMRRHLAELNGTTHAEKFGTLRPSELKTPHGGRYKPFFTEFLTNIIPQYQGQPCLQVTDHTIADGEVGVRAAIIGLINGQEIPLTRYEVTDDAGSAWVHVDPKYINTLLEYTQSLINTACLKPINAGNKEEVDQITQQIAKIHWWLAQATPFKRGSAAIAEWIIMGIFQYHGLSVDWKKGLPDCWALITPNPDDFAKRYLEFSNVQVRHTPAIESKKSDLQEHSLFSSKQADTSIKEQKIERLKSER